jgi:hypothetical protein
MSVWKGKGLERKRGGGGDKFKMNKSVGSRSATKIGARARRGKTAVFNEVN